MRTKGPAINTEADVPLRVGPDGVAWLQLARVTIDVQLTKTGYEGETRGEVAYGGGHELAVQLLDLIHVLGYLGDVDEEAIGPNLQPLGLETTDEASSQ